MYSDIKVYWRTDFFIFCILKYVFVRIFVCMHCTYANALLFFHLFFNFIQNCLTAEIAICKTVWERVSQWKQLLCIQLQGTELISPNVPIRQKPNDLHPVEQSNTISERMDFICVSVQDTRTGSKFMILSAISEGDKLSVSLLGDTIFARSYGIVTLLLRKRCLQFLILIYYYYHKQKKRIKTTSKHTRNQPDLFTKH